MRFLFGILVISTCVSADFIAGVGRERVNGTKDAAIRVLILRDGKTQLVFASLEACAASQQIIDAVREAITVPPRFVSEVIVSSLPVDPAGDRIRCIDAARNAALAGAASLGPVAVFGHELTHDYSRAELPDQSLMSISIRDRNGRRIALLLNSTIPAGPSNIASELETLLPDCRPIVLMMPRSREGKWVPPLPELGIVSSAKLLMDRVTGAADTKEIRRIGPSASGPMRGFRLGDFFIAAFPVDLRTSTILLLKRRFREARPFFISAPEEEPVASFGGDQAVINAYDRIAKAAGFRPSRCRSVEPTATYAVHNGFLWQFNELAECDNERPARTGSKAKLQGGVSYVWGHAGGTAVSLRGGAIELRSKPAIRRDWTIGFVIRSALSFRDEQTCATGQFFEAPGVRLAMQPDCTIALQGVNTKAALHYSWNHIALVRRVNEVALYLEGVRIAIAPVDANLNVTTPAARISSNNLDVDDLVFWRTAFTEKRIYATMSAKLTPRTPIDCERFPQLCSPH